MLQTIVTLWSSIIQGFKADHICYVKYRIEYSDRRLRNDLIVMQQNAVAVKLPLLREAIGVDICASSHSFFTDRSQVYCVPL